jgi:hypothetical protein
MVKISSLKEMINSEQHVGTERSRSVTDKKQ